MKQYKYNGEVFEITQDGDCKLLVSDGKNSVSVEASDKFGRQPFVYRLENGLGWQANSEESAVEGACRKLVELQKPRPSQEDLCKTLSEFYDKLS
ncbi:MAG: hypothetical protein OXE52_15945 [Chloroflexi bacterium]|nr:hypothetical protein [Chloroflexota bacterium]